MEPLELDAADRELIAAAREAVRRSFHPVRHTVGAAVRGASGRIHVGVNLESCGYGPCAEPVAVGAAVTAGEPGILAVVAVVADREGCPVLPPCGNCRQLLADYAPEAWVIVEDGGRLCKVRAAELLPFPYHFHG
jgi:cytidine deaminase